MRRFTVVLAFILMFAACSWAQMEPKPMEIPRTELYLGYQWQHAGISDNVADVGSTGLKGFDFQFAHYFPKNLGIIVDLSHGSNTRVDSTGVKYTRSTYMGGVGYRLHSFSIFTPSVHGLVGVDHDDLTVPFSATSFDFRDTNFAAAGGATFDANLSRHFAVRLAQVDYVYTRHYGSNQSSFRYTGGVVARF